MDWTGALLAKDASPDVVASSPWQIFGCKNGVCRTRLPEANKICDSGCGLSNKQSMVRVLHEYEMINIYGSLCCGRGSFKATGTDKYRVEKVNVKF